MPPSRRGSATSVATPVRQQRHQRRGPCPALQLRFGYAAHRWRCPAATSRVRDPPARLGLPGAIIFFADVVEDQLGQLLTTFAIPQERREALIQRWQELRGERQSTEAERARLERKAEQVKLLYIEGELEDAEYRRQRAQVAESLAAIPVDDLPSTEAVGRRLAQMLADLSEAWTLATSVERNGIAREVFTDVVIENRTAVAVKPRPELAPFFASLECQPEASVTSERKRRDSNPRSQP